MIRLPRVPVPEQARDLLARRTRNVEEAGGTSRAARTEWERAHAPKKHVRTALEGMARGAVRCMYCDDSRATDIDHFEPLERAPLRAFEWLNHLLACSHCNSNAKREQYPVDGDGNCLLVDPTAEDPADHLRLLLHTGEYAAVADSAKGEETIEVFGLNRPDLVKGRQDAFHRARSNLRDWHQLRKQADHEAAREAARVAQALLDSPFVDVVHVMARLTPAVALIVVGPLTVPALDAWKAEGGPWARWTAGWAP
ncbi:HNH endonuclease [Streptomyces sp. SID11385]|uniref:HNH endonuclease n=1 Tax=Streptomyces sp. SID11385 TaxID=2706031 RepID=UPI0013CA0762|nr:HNH endonuclease [Streptomyces sp. SID11385]NEA44498.1 HNH endonuclease [Streptomyces sp. SID11385]